MAKAKKSAPKKAAPKKAAKKRAKRKATPAQLAALAKGRAARKAKAKKSAPKRAKKAAPKRAKKAAPKRARKAAPKKRAKKRARKGEVAQAASRLSKAMGVTKKAPKRRRRRTIARGVENLIAKMGASKPAPKRKRRRAAPKRSAPKRPAARRGRVLVGVPPHAPGETPSQCVKCGRVHTLREHWSHRVIHGQSLTQASYKCARGGVCEFAATQRAKGKRRRALASGEAKVLRDATKNQGRLSVAKQAQLLMLQARLEKMARRK